MRCRTPWRLRDHRVAATCDELGRLLPAGGSGALECEVVRQQVHWGSVNMEICVRRGANRRYFFVKKARRGVTGVRPGRPDRVRLKPVPDPATKLCHESAALRTIDGMVAESEGEPWFAVPVVAELPDALVLERFDCPTLAARIDSGEPAEDLRPAVRAAGSWLRRFHDLDGLEHTQDHLTTAEEVAELLRGLTAHVSDLGRRDAVAIDSLIDPMCAALPAGLELGLAHGDFAAQNVFVDGRSRVAVFDTGAALRMPPHVDLAYFSVMLEFAGIRRLVSLQGRRSLWSELTDDLLDGYGDPPPRHEIIPFELAVLLEKQASLVTNGIGTPLRHHAKALRRTLVVRRLQAAVDARLVEIRGC